MWHAMRDVGWMTQRGLLCCVLGIVGAAQMRNCWTGRQAGMQQERFRGLGLGACRAACLCHPRQQLAAHVLLFARQNRNKHHLAVWRPSQRAGRGHDAQVAGGQPGGTGSRAGKRGAVTLTGCTLHCCTLHCRHAFHRGNPICSDQSAARIQELGSVIYPAQHFCKHCCSSGQMCYIPMGRGLVAPDGTPATRAAAADAHRAGHQLQHVANSLPRLPCWRTPLSRATRLGGTAA